MVWLAVRALGAVVMVPLAEELAFRGLLYRWLIARNFDAVAFTRWSWLAFVISSVLFGVLHERIIAGALAGAAFALLMVRSGRLADPIFAHTAANATIIAWAFTASQWSLL